MDNQAVLGALPERKPKPAQSLIDQILSQVETVWQRASDPTFRLEIGWVKGHSGIKGNEKVNAEAKEAAKGQSSRTRSLPDFLTGGDLPMSISAQRQAFEAAMLERWRKEWGESPRHV